MLSSVPDNNVFETVKEFYDPELSSTPLVGIPESLNPFATDGVKIYAKLHSALPAGNVKSLPALNMLKNAGIESPDSKIKKVVEYSSGSTAMSLAIIGNVYGIAENLEAYLSNKTSEAKLKLMRFYGIDLRLFGGPSQPDPTDSRGGIAAAAERGQQPEVFNANQYENSGNYEAHVKWTGPQLARQCPDMKIFACGLGTGGTSTGTGLALKKLLPNVIRVGVTTQPGDRVPGPRSEALLGPVKFPWRDAIDTMEWVGSEPSYRLSMQLCRNGLQVGPSSGFNLQGLFQYLTKLKESGELQRVREASGGIVKAVFLCCDLPYQYTDDYFTKLPATDFGTIKNENLLGVDVHRYDDAWELEPREVLERYLTVKESKDGPLMDSSAYSSPSSSAAPSRRPSTVLSSTSSEDSHLFSDYHCSEGGSEETSSSQHSSGSIIVIDLRRSKDIAPSDFVFPSHAEVVSLPLKSLSKPQVSPFFDPSLLREQWLELEQKLKEVPLAKMSGSGIKTLVVDYEGDTARVACSILQSKGLDACFIKGGMTAYQQLEG